VNFPDWVELKKIAVEGFSVVGCLEEAVFEVGENDLVGNGPFETVVGGFGIDKTKSFGGKVVLDDDCFEIDGS